MGVRYEPCFVQPLDAKRIRAHAEALAAAAERLARSDTGRLAPDALRRYLHHMDLIAAWADEALVRSRLAWRCAGCRKVRNLEAGHVFGRLGTMDDYTQVRDVIANPDTWRRYCMNEKCVRKAGHVPQLDTTLGA